ncbi:MAG TPA: RHS repeat-associated core domain-containing protein [Luteibacter sp.]|uniref:RHS repeat-associated core domain-containing protein n=1 Tax=Luteibacter sp. TaxID=1886636 RepID=UPI002F3E7DA8
MTYYYSDPQGTVLATADAQGQVTATFDKKPFGADVLGPSGGPGFTSHYGDEETSLVYMQARYYDPTVGRFLSRDPLQGKANSYAYALDNPYSFIDPDGRDDCSDTCMSMRRISDNFNLGRSGDNFGATPTLIFGEGTDKVAQTWSENKHKIVSDLARSNHLFRPGTKIKVDVSATVNDPGNFDGRSIVISALAVGENGFNVAQLGGILGHEMYHAVDYLNGRINFSNDIFSGYAPRARSEVNAYRWGMRTRAHYDFDDPAYVEQFQAGIDRFTPCANNNCNLNVF